jgi:acyl-CoA synthetase (AMP-forming)/AMP-acid ligase II
MLNMRPLWPIAAVIVAAHLAAGGTVVLGGSFEPARFVAELRRWGAGSSSLVPTHLVRLLRDANPGELAALGALRAIDVGGAAIAPETFAAAVDALGPKIGVLYGLTEAPWSCYQPPGDLIGADGKVQPARMRTVGRAVPGCDVMIAEGSNEVLLRGAHVMRGYWKRPRLTDEVLQDGWFRTGDEGRLDEAGVLSITGRIKEVIRSGGKSVQPGEVERALCAHPGVAEAAVVGLPDAEWGEIVAAAVVAAPGAALTPKALMEHCQAQLSAHKRPKVIRLVEALPRSHYGKVQRAKLRAALTGA